MVMVLWVGASGEDMTHTCYCGKIYECPFCYTKDSGLNKHVIAIQEFVDKRQRQYDGTEDYNDPINFRGGKGAKSSS